MNLPKRWTRGLLYIIAFYMRRLFPVLLIILIASGCKKSENNIAWEATYGKGDARFIRVTSNSGLIACGTSEAQPYLVRLDENKMKVVEISADMQGVFTSALYDTSGYITGGSTGGKMLLMRHSKAGNKLWEKIIDQDFNIDQTQLLVIDDNIFLAIGSASPDTTYEMQTGLLFISFDSTGQVLKEQKYISGFFIASYDAAPGNSGTIYLALTRKEAFSEPKATVAKFNNDLQHLWEVELANNPEYGAATLAVIHDGSGMVYVAGRTELPKEGGGIIHNSFVSAISDEGSLSWKKYPESSNSGTALLLNSAGELVVLNANCFFINILEPVSGTDAGRIRMFDECDPNTTDALASDFDIDLNNDFVVAGSLGGSFYLGVKSAP
jgi:hypothetical protein